MRRFLQILSYALNSETLDSVDADIARVTKKAAYFASGVIVIDNRSTNEILTTERALIILLSP